MGVYWHRLVIDEIQQVGGASAPGGGSAQGYLSRRAENAMALEAAFRWCVSGTPLEREYQTRTPCTHAPQAHS
jgi:SNF2 family DNA or RNA helicase